MDATYGRRDALLLEIHHLWAYSYRSWTPLLLRLSVLAEGDRPKGPSTPLERFFVESGPPDEFVHEFLYLQCGHSDGKPSWGRVGYTNAALLYPDALEYLLGRIGFSRT